MEFKQLLIMIRKKILFVTLIPAFASIIAAITSMFLVAPVYEASSTLYIINQKSVLESPVNYEEILTNQQLIKDYRELIKSKLIIKTVLEELNIQDITPAELAKRITVNSKNDTRVMQIKVEDTIPVRCMELSNKICEVFIEKATGLAKINNIGIVDAAELPISPIKPKPLLYSMLSFLLSFMVTVGIFYLLELLNETIKTSEDIETYLSLSVLGTIPSFNLK